MPCASERPASAPGCHVGKNEQRVPERSRRHDRGRVAADRRARPGGHVDPRGPGADARAALAAQFQKTGSTATDAAERATLLICAAEGAVLLARARRSIEPLELIAEQLRGGQA